jgi:hypothetical protein
MTIKTKKYKLEPSTYASLGLQSILKEFWWVWFIPATMIIIGLIWPASFWWMFGTAIVISLLYIIFWYAQFAGAAQMDQAKPLFERMSYEIDSRQVLVKLNAKQGMPIGWDKVQKASLGKKAATLTISRGQFVYLPYEIFRSDNDINHLKTILKRKGLIK